ncbi:hypothetical protein EDD16DRAFT_1683442 [Pisolithus croceorrhizus]|nr:hypothetical protein EDD16DRAFT_1683442 [Pisolithus croceorrhizus]
MQTSWQMLHPCFLLPLRTAGNIPSFQVGVPGVCIDRKKAFRSEPDEACPSNRDRYGPRLRWFCTSRYKLVEG